MRGKRPQNSRRIRTRRIIPAHAGQTCGRRGRCRLRPDHPRACGANTWYAGFGTRFTGSSPRMRGKLVHRATRRLSDRIIPAHAGQTTQARRRTLSLSDHPRACGANLQPGREGEADAGSSPRMRGKHAPGVVQVGEGRIIPAHAGQTYNGGSPSTAAPDHPRACGANTWSLTGNVKEDGSSPRMRGKRRHQLLQALLQRIIPAHAGQTHVCSPCSKTKSDHPRACGANTVCVGCVWVGCGSSPRMRGKQWDGYGRTYLARIIPAHAGQTSVVFSRPVSCADHPRACGANCACESALSAVLGSSPRMRGKPRRH